MAQKDFASKKTQRRAATRKEPPAPRKSVAPAPPARSKWPLVIALLALVALAALLAVLLKRPESPAPSTAAPQPAPATKPQAPAPQAEKPAAARAPGQSLPLDDVALDQGERFEFYRLLQENEVQTPDESAYTSTPKTAALDGTYILQTGSFRNQSDAESMRARLTLSNLPNVNTRRVEGQNGVWYRVTTGPFTTYAELKDATNRLEKLNIHPIRRKIN